MGPQEIKEVEQDVMCGASSRPYKGVDVVCLSHQGINRTFLSNRGGGGGLGKRSPGQSCFQVLFFPVG